MKFTGRIREPEKLTASFPALKLPLSGGYEEGYADGRTDGYTEGEQAARAEAVAHNAAILTDCNAVLPDKGVEPADTLAQVPQRIEEIQSYSDGYDVGLEDGKQAEYDRFWDTLQERGKRKTYNHAFYAPSTTYATVQPWWNDDTFRPKYPIICRAGNGGDYMLTFSMVTRISVRIEVYRYDSQTEKLLYNNPYLETVEELWVQDGCTFNNWFTNDVALKNITFADGSVIASSISFADSPDLTDASTQSIVNAFADRSGKPAITLTVHKKVGERMPAAQKAALAAKNVTLAY